MADMDYCDWGSVSDGGRCCYLRVDHDDADSGYCEFHRAFRRNDAQRMCEVLMENDDGRIPAGIAIVSAVKRSDGAYDLILRAYPEKENDHADPEDGYSRRV